MLRTYIEGGEPLMNTHAASPVLTDLFNLAHAVATRYCSSHPQLNRDDCLSIANEALAVLLSESIPTRDQVSRRVENRCFAELLRVKNRARREEAISTDEFGEPLNSILDLRAVPSLNPSACRHLSVAQPSGTNPDPHPKGFLDALHFVCASAAIQNGKGPETEYYRFRSAENRERVSVECRRERQRKQYRLKVAALAA